MDDLLPTVLLILFMATFVVTWLDWRRRVKRLGGIVGPSWDCPACGVVNEANSTVCWSCSAAINGHGLFQDLGPTSADTWRCRRCGAWNGKARHSCWSCASAPAKRPKGEA